MASCLLMGRAHDVTVRHSSLPSELADNNGVLCTSVRGGEPCFGFSRFRRLIRTALVQLRCGGARWRALQQRSTQLPVGPGRHEEGAADETSGPDRRTSTPHAVRAPVAMHRCATKLPWSRCTCSVLHTFPCVGPPCHTHALQRIAASLSRAQGAMLRRLPACAMREGVGRQQIAWGEHLLTEVL